MTASRRANPGDGKNHPDCHPERSVSVRFRTETRSRRTPSTGTVPELWRDFSARYKNPNQIKTVLAIGVLLLRGKFASRTFHSAQDDKGLLRDLAFLHHSRDSYKLNT